MPHSIDRADPRTPPRHTQNSGIRAVLAVAVAFIAFGYAYAKTQPRATSAPRPAPAPPPRVVTRTITHVVTRTVSAHPLLTGADIVLIVLICGVVVLGGLSLARRFR
jgi:hypothetical protein